MLSSTSLKALINPITKSNFLKIDNNNIVFNDNSALPIFNEIPILLSTNSIFNFDDIRLNVVTTQDGDFTDKKKFKNHFRKKILPSLCNDFKINERYKELSNKINKTNGNVLIIGSGDKVNYYKELFKNCNVIASDVHLQLQPDCVIDAHEIPFKNDFFDLVFAAQVIEHTINPWLVSTEFQRVTKNGGYIQIEAPQSYPYHGQPYDFFRFTFTGMRSLFSKCKLEKCNITESNAAMVAVTISNYFVNLSSNKYYRRGAVFITRFMFGWLKYLDNYNLNKRTISFPKGYAMTFIKDSRERKGVELFEEFYNLKD